MLSILSPAKKLLNTGYTGTTTEPPFLAKTAELITLMKAKSSEEIAELMHISNDLANLNYKRFQQFAAKSADNPESGPALFLFHGDVYQAMEAASWDQQSVAFAQEHLLILSGLYGLLRPLDQIQPYRLEMGVRLANASGPNLYDFWQDQIAQRLNTLLAAEQNPVLINLASSEYFKAVPVKKIKFPVVTVNFYEREQDRLKMIGIFAKKARGAMAKYLMLNQIDDLDALKAFSAMGYEYSPESSSETQFDFIRGS